ncbi:MAG: hypothetical protein ACOZCL_11740 [Bacillota bacterium]
MSKKLTALLLAFVLVFSTFTMAFAEETLSGDAAIVAAIGMLKGDSEAGVTAEYLASTPTRLQAAILFLRLKGLEEEALAYTGTENFPDAVGYSWAGGEAIMGYLKAHPELGWQGTYGNFLPTEKINAQSYYKVILEALGYKQNTASVVGDFDWSEVFEFAADLGLIAVADVEDFTVNDIAIATVEGLVTPMKDSEVTLAASLVTAGIIDPVVAAEAGIYEEEATELELAVAAAEEAIAALNAEIALADKEAVVAARALVAAAQAIDAAAVISNIDVLAAAEAKIAELELAAMTYDIKSATILSSKVIEVTLNTAATAVAPNFTVTDAAGTAIAVASAEFSPWNTDNKSILVTLAADTTAGTLYTIKSGTAAANFGGVAKETVKPTATVASTDYNEVTVTFSEAVDARTIVFSAAEKYGTKAALNVTLKQIKSSTEVVFTSDAQSSATLYGTVISGVKDFAGNEMTKDEAKTFVGQAMNTNKQGLDTITVNDSVTLVVAFDINVDQAAATNIANYAIAEKYGSKTVVPVTAAEMNKDANGVVLPKQVKLTLGADTKTGTLYEMVVTNVGTAYGKEINADDDTKTFVGIDKDTKAPNAVTATSDSNTQITLTFTDANGADNLPAAVDTSLITIAEKYGSKAALTLTLKEVKNNTIVFTTSTQAAATLYEVKVAKGLTDKLGNATTAELTTTVVGSGVATKISAISAITDNTSTTGKIRVQFNKNYGTGGLDVASYYIDGGIGYPTKVEAVAGNPDKVDLTVAKTVTGKLYKMTVKNVSNSDGVAMDAAGVSLNFVGTGGAAVAEPKLEAAIAMNNQMVKLYFDTEVKGITGLINSTTNAVIANAIEYGTVTDPGDNSLTDFNYGFIDPENSKVLIVYTTADNAFNTGNANGIYYINVDGVTAMDNNYDEVTMAKNTTEPAEIAIEGVVATSANTMTIYFNQAVRHLGVTDNATSADEFAFVDVNGNGTYQDGTDGEIVAARALNTTKTQWEVRINQTLANQQYSLVINTGAAAAIISDVVSGTRTTALDTDVTSIAFAGNATNITYINDVYAVATDARTIVVYYPEDMDKASAETTENYDIDADAATILLATYNDDNNTVTLIVSEDIDASTDEVVIDANDITNAIGNKQVETELGANLEVVFAKSTTTPAKVGIKEVVADVAANTVTITFDQRFMSATSLDFDNTADAGVTETAALLAALNITVDGTDTIEAAEISDINTLLGAADVLNSSAGYIDTIVINLTVDIDDNQQASVSFDKPATQNFTGIKGQIQDVDAAAYIFVQ